jgi:hypothetical protein
LALATVVALVSTCVGLLFAELAVRLVAPQQLIQIRPDLWQSVDTLGWTRRPNVSLEINTGERSVDVLTDDDGFRVGRDGRRKAASQILLLGDSFVEALQVQYEHTAGHLLETELSNHLRRPVAVRNAGVSGWNPNHYLLRTRQLLSRDTFALIVVAIFVGNDAVGYRYDRMAPRARGVQHEFRVPRRLAWSEFVDALFSPINDGLEVRSHLYILAKNQLSTLRMRLGMTKDYLPPEYRLVEANSTRWRNTAEICADLARAAAARSVPVLFVLIPERFQVYPDEFRRYLRGFGIDSATVDVDQPSTLLSGEFAAAGLTVVDLLPTMRAAAASGPRLYGTVDQHLSAAGHQVLAAALRPEMMRLLR